MCLNTGGAIGAWTYIREHLVADNRDVVCLQEVSMRPTETTGFLKMASGLGYAGYAQGSIGNLGGSGGLVTLVRRNTPQRPSWGSSLGNAEVLGVWVAGWLVTNMYAHPNEEGPAQAGRLLLDSFIAERVARSQPWILMGDHNELPGDSSVMSVAQALGGAYHGTGQPTRWEGNREIDWAVCNRSSFMSSVCFGDSKISDRKSLLFEVLQTYTPVKVGVLPRTGDLTKPQDVPTDDWRRALRDSWVCNPVVANLSAMIEQGNFQVQALWDEFQRVLQSTFAAAFFKVGRQSPVRSRLLAKGRVATVKWENQACQGPRIPNGNLAARKKRRLLARLFDYQRIASRRAEGIASEQELRNFESLSHRLGSPSTQATRDLIHDATTQLRAHEEEVKRKNLKAWRDRLFTCCSEVSKWLKAKDNPYVNCVSTVGDDERVVRTSSVVEASLAIYNYWKDFWLRLDRTRPSLDRRAETLLATIEPPDQEVALPLPTGADLLGKARKGGGSWLA